MKSGHLRDYNLCNSQGFETLAYDINLFNKNAPPAMRYIPSYKMLRKIMNVIAKYDSIDEII